MNFSEILDQIARPARPEIDSGYARPAAASFWSVLDGIEAASPVRDASVRQAYFPEAGPREALARGVGEVAAADLSLDPDDILFELDLGEVATLEDLSILRRRFARLNHPDRVPAELRDRANQRMTIANALIDEAASRLAG